MHNAKVVLGAGEALIGGLAVPLRRLGVVLRHAQAGAIHNAKVVLGVGDSGVPLIGKRTIKPQRSREVASVASYRGIL
jgi:hypothetical protein